MPTPKPSATSPRSPAPKPVRALRYVGPEALFDIPARDLSVEDIERLARSPYIGRRFTSSPSALSNLLSTVLVNGHFIYRPVPDRPEKET